MTWIIDRAVHMSEVRPKYGTIYFYSGRVSLYGPSWLRAHSTYRVHPVDKKIGKYFIFI
jgi:hypothetical protein